MKFDAELGYIMKPQLLFLFWFDWLALLLLCFFFFFFFLRIVWKESTVEMSCGSTHISTTVSLNLPGSF